MHDGSRESLVLHRPELERRGGRARLKAVLEGGGTRRELWFEGEEAAAPWLVHERSDAFAVPVLLHAMQRHTASLRLEAPLSERLQYTWNNFLAPALAHACPGFREVSLECDSARGSLESAGAVGTGLSCGVDSFCTVADHWSEAQPPGYRLTHCAVFDVGNHSPLTSEPKQTRLLFERRVARARAAAREMGLPLVVLESNVDDIVPRPFAAFHTFRNISAVLALQKLFRVYCYSSGHSAQHFRFGPQDSGDYDIFSLPMLSTETVELFPSGTLLTRVEKTRRVAAFAVARGHLNVCLYEDRNCSVCEKCLRTLLTLDLLGSVRDFAQVFDLDRYGRNRDWFIGYVLTYAPGNSHYREIACAMAARAFLDRPAAYYRGLWYRERLARAVKRRMGAPAPTF